MAHKRKPVSEPAIRRRYQMNAGWYHPQRGRKPFDELFIELDEYAPSNETRRRQIMDGWKLLHHGNLGTKHVLYIDLGSGHFQVIEEV